MTKDTLKKDFFQLLFILMFIGGYLEMNENMKSLLFLILGIFFIVMGIRSGLLQNHLHMILWFAAGCVLMRMGLFYYPVWMVPPILVAAFCRGPRRVKKWKFIK